MSTQLIQHRFDRPRLHMDNVEPVQDDDLADAIRRIRVDKLLAKYGPKRLRIAHERAAADAAAHDVAELTNDDNGNDWDWIS